ncbi:unnamed protein product [Aureobasidium mustum]|uniref:ADF-H domain-containing protein n=1 Tax=Aureobasidium mustum TaxID=2773714 RepID=A0A9N8JNL0_9PEZI|nr:unnamed protein product [Aureobasidium mustum]
MASEARLYTFSPETKTALRKFPANTVEARTDTPLHTPQKRHRKSSGNREDYTTRGEPSNTEETRVTRYESAEWLKPLSQGTDQIDKKTLEISKADDEVYTDLSLLGEELPDHSPRFILLSYPLTMVRRLFSFSTFYQPQLWNVVLTQGPFSQASGRLSVPYVMLYYLPVTCNSELKMVYAGAKELMRNQAEVGRIIEIDSAEELEEIEDQLRGEE